MSEQTRRPPAADSGAQPNTRPSGPAAGAVARPPHESEPCPACGAALRLWANYHRCRNCGYKESCCF